MYVMPSLMTMFRIAILCLRFIKKAYSCLFYYLIVFFVVISIYSFHLIDWIRWIPRYVDGLFWVRVGNFLDLQIMFCDQMWASMCGLSMNSQSLCICGCVGCSLVIIARSLVYVVGVQEVQDVLKLYPRSFFSNHLRSDSRNL